MHLNQLRYFASVARYRSFTQAAQCHFLTQTAITQQIKALEDSLGFPLINRKKRPIELTPAGAVFYQETKAILARMDEAVAKAQEASQGTEGVIRIGYEKGYERSRLSDHLREFHRAYPNILFTCIREDTDRLAGKLLSDELDVIFPGTVPICDPIPAYAAGWICAPGCRRRSTAVIPSRTENLCGVPSFGRRPFCICRRRERVILLGMSISCSCMKKPDTSPAFF